MIGMASDAETQVELEETSSNMGDDTTADVSRDLVQALQPAIRVRADGVTLPIVDTVAMDDAPRIVAPPPGVLSLEQYAWLYASQLAGESDLARALDEAGLTPAQYAAWRAHWESRLMHNDVERTRWFALVAKLQT